MAATPWELQRSNPVRASLRLVDEPTRAAARRSVGVYRRRRAMALATAVAAAATVGALAAQLGEGPGREAPAGSATTAGAATVVVGPGDTVWDLAAVNRPPGREPSSYVAEVVALNGLDPSRLRPGTVLRLP